MTVNSCNICGCIPPNVGQDFFQQAALNLLCGILENTTGGGVASAVNVNQIGGSSYALGQTTMANSAPVVIASDQSNLPTNLAAVGGSAVTLGQKTMANSIPVVLASDQSYIKAEDSVHVSGDLGIMSLAVRQDTLSALAANGDYIPFTTDSSGRLRTIVSGPIDQGNAVSFSPPILLGNMAATSNPGSISNGQMVRTLADLIGRIVVINHGLPENTFYAVSAADITDLTSTQVAAAIASTRYYISAITVSNMHASVSTRVDILDGATVVWSGPAAKDGGGYTITFPQQIRCTSNTAINAQCGTTGAAVRVAISGTKSAV